MIRLAPVVCALSCALAAPARAQLTIIEQERYVRTSVLVSSGSAEPVSDIHQVDAPDLEAFDQFIVRTVGPLGPGVISSASASQTSNLGTAAISFEAHVSSTSAIFAPFDEAAGSGSSTLHIIFELESPQVLRFDAEAARSIGPSFVQAYVSPRDGGEPFALFQLNALSGELHEEIFLPVGQYSFHAAADAATGLFGGSGSGFFTDSTSAQATISLTVVPAPTAACLLGLGGLLAAARRGRSA